MLRNTDLKKHIFNTKRRLRVDDVKNIVAAISSAGKILEDRTWEHPFNQEFEDGFPLPRFPESADRKILGLDSVTFNLDKNKLTSDPALDSMCKLFEHVRFSKRCNFSLRESDDVCGAGVHLELFYGNQDLPNELAVRLEHANSDGTEMMEKLLASGSWPVKWHKAGQGLKVTHTAGGLVSFKAIDEGDHGANLYTIITCPGWPVEKVFLHFTRTIHGCRRKFKSGDWSFSPDEGEIKDWKALDGIIEALIRSDVPAKRVLVNGIVWRLASYHGFQAMAEMHKKLRTEGDIVTRLFEFELGGQRGYMELGYEEGGFCAFFSFDTKEPFTVLSNITGQKLKAWS